MKLKIQLDIVKQKLKSQIYKILKKRKKIKNNIKMKKLMKKKNMK